MYGCSQGYYFLDLLTASSCVYLLTENVNYNMSYSMNYIHELQHELKEL